MSKAIFCRYSGCDLSKTSIADKHCIGKEMKRMDESSIWVVLVKAIWDLMGEENCSIKITALGYEFRISAVRCVSSCQCLCSLGCVEYHKIIGIYWTSSLRLSFFKLEKYYGCGLQSGQLRFSEGRIRISKRRIFQEKY